jgi:hypothetical protein
LGTRWVLVGYSYVGYSLGTRWVLVGYSLGTRWVLVGYSLGTRWVLVIYPILARTRVTSDKRVSSGASFK